MTKSFHTYSDKELKVCCNDTLEGKYTLDGYYVLAHTTDCAIALMQIYFFNNKYDAINYFYDLIKEWKDVFTNIEYSDLCGKIETVLMDIIKNKTDEHIALDFMDFSTDQMNFCILEEGYSTDGVHKIANHIEEIFQIEIEFLRGYTELGDSDQPIDESNLAEGDKETIRLLKSYLKICNMLSTANDTTTETYISEFMSLAEFFNDYFDE